jgi:hypothetical protein
VQVADFSRLQVRFHVAVVSPRSTQMISKLPNLEGSTHQLSLNKKASFGVRQKVENLNPHEFACYQRTRVN